MFDMIVFDECHHVLKDHPHRKLAVKLGITCENLPPQLRPRVVGFTASVTYAVDEKKKEHSMKRLCTDMRVEEIATAKE
jgi:superfamily II DNA or RNA helicase